MTVLVGAGSKPARCDNDYILLILGGFGTCPYEVCYLGSVSIDRMISGKDYIMITNFPESNV